MKNRRKKREAFAEHSYWQSYSDMMAALLLVFVLIIAITLAIYRQKTVDLDQARLDLNAAQTKLDQAALELEDFRAKIELSNEELNKSLAELQEAYAQAALTEEELNKAYLEIEDAQNELEVTKNELQDIVEIRTDIIGALQSAFNNSAMSVDAQTGSITFSSDVLFNYNSAVLTDASKQTLRDTIPMYLGVLLRDEYQDYIAEIIIEGHTDTVGSYLSNQQLSYNRANSVARFCLDSGNGLNETEIARLQQVLTVNGRSFSNPVYTAEAPGAELRGGHGRFQAGGDQVPAEGGRDDRKDLGDPEGLEEKQRKIGIEAERGDGNCPLVDVCPAFCYTERECFHYYLERNERGMTKIRGRVKELWLDFSV